MVSKLKPVFNSNWNKVAEEYNKMCPDTQRTANALKTKFQELLAQSRRKPTGQTEVPGYLQKAKEINEAIN